MKATWICLPALLLPQVLKAQSADQLIAAHQLSVHVMQVQAATLGSAVALGDHAAVTNCHVLGEATSAYVMRGALGSRAKLKAGDTGHDLCLLEVESSPAVPAKVGRARSLALGDRVYAVGFGAGRLSFALGEVKGLYPVDGDFIIRSDAPFAEGASGGALFDGAGNLVGVLTFFRRGVHTSSYWAMPSEWIGLLTDSRAATIDRSRLPIWSEARSGSVRFLEVAGYEIDGDWDQMRTHAEQWLAEEPDNREAMRAVEFGNSRLREMH
jgi:serine protease Do